MAGQIVEVARRTLARDFRSIDPSAARVVLLDAGPRVLPAFGDRLSDKALVRLRRLGVDVVLDRTVVDVDAHGVTVEDPAGTRTSSGV